MFFETLPGWLWVLFAWLVGSVCFGMALARWFRWLRE